MIISYVVIRHLVNESHFARSLSPEGLDCSMVSLMKASEDFALSCARLRQLPVGDSRKGEGCMVAQALIRYVTRPSHAVAVWWEHCRIWRDNANEKYCCSMAALVDFSPIGEDTVKGTFRG